MSSGGGSPDKLKSVNEMERRLDNLEKENFNLRMKLFYHQESWANSKSDEAMAKEIVELKVSGREDYLVLWFTGATPCLTKFRGGVWLMDSDGDQ